MEIADTTRDQLQSLINDFIVGFVKTAPKILLILLLTFLAFKLLRYLANRMEQYVAEGAPEKRAAKRQKVQTLSRVIVGTGTIVVLMVSAMMVMQELGIEVGPLIAGAGIAGLAIGFGAQNMVRDFIAGFFILLEGQFSVGDVVKIAGIGGLVDSMSLRVTVIRDIEGIVHYIPNGEIKTVSNMTKEWSRALLHFDVAYKEDLDRVTEVLWEVLNEFKEDPEFGPLLVNDPVIPGVEKLGDSGVTIRVMVDTKPIKQWDVMRELRKRVKKRFDETGIEIPFPQRAVWMRGEDAE